MERSLVLIKPDAMERGLAGTIIGRLEGEGLNLDQILGEYVFSPSGKLDIEFDPPLLIEKSSTPTKVFITIDVSAMAERNHVIRLYIESASDVSMDKGVVTIETENAQFSYIGSISNEIVIDGAFSDWENKDVYLDSDDEEINNKNIDVNRYRIAQDDDKLSFYFDVDGTMMGGVSIPIESRRIIQRQNKDDRKITPISQELKINKIELESIEKELPA